MAAQLCSDPRRRGQPWAGLRPALSCLCPCRGKSCRTITFEQFQEALEELAKKRFKDKSSEEAVREVHRLIEGKAPIISGVTVSRAGMEGGAWRGAGGGAGRWVVPGEVWSGGTWIGAWPGGWGLGRRGQEGYGWGLGLGWVLGGVVRRAWPGVGSGEVWSEGAWIGGLAWGGGVGPGRRGREGVAWGSVWGGLVKRGMGWGAIAWRVGPGSPDSPFPLRVQVVGSPAA